MYICLIKKEGVRPANINIMSQYKAQCSKIKERLKKHHVQNVNTVAGSQGNVDFYAPPPFQRRQGKLLCCSLSVGRLVGPSTVSVPSLSKGLGEIEQFLIEL